MADLCSAYVFLARYNLKKRNLEAAEMYAHKCCEFNEVNYFVCPRSPLLHVSSLKNPLVHLLICLLSIHSFLGPLLSSSILSFLLLLTFTPSHSSFPLPCFPLLLVLFALLPCSFSPFHPTPSLLFILLATFFPPCFLPP